MTRQRRKMQVDVRNISERQGTRWRLGAFESTEVVITLCASKTSKFDDFRCPKPVEFILTLDASPPSMGQILPVMLQSHY